MRALSRRAFLGGAVATMFVGVACGSSEDGAPSFDAEAAREARLDPPAAPELADHTPRFVEEARAYLVVVPAAVRPRARLLLPPETRTGLEHGLLALSDACPKDQLQLRFCESSTWFECPGCGSQFDGLGDRKAGPAPTGMWFHRVTVGDDDEVAVDAKPRIRGLGPDVALVQHRPAGTFCV
jgi:hypothetical protein